MTRFHGRSWVAWLTALAAGCCLAVAARRSGPLPGDRSVGRWIQSLPGPLERPFELLQVLTATESAALLCCLFAVALAVSGRRREAMVVVAALVALLVLQPAIKEFADRPRPSPGLLEQRVGFSSPSFPAGHVMSGTVLIGLIALVAGRPRPVLPVLVLVALLNGAASVYLGAHWPTDVVGGTVWATVILVPAKAALSRWQA